MNSGLQYDEDDVERLLIGLVNNESLARRTSPWLEAHHLQSQMNATVWQCAIWHGLREWLEDHTNTGMPPEGYLGKLAEGAARRYYKDREAGMIARVMSAEFLLIEPDLQDARTRLAYIHDACVQAPRVRALYDEAQSTLAWDTFAASVIDAKEQKTNELAQNIEEVTSDAFGVLSDPFTPLDAEAEEAAIEAAKLADIETGVPYMDTVQGGTGLYRGFTTLVLGPTGGGKTIMCCELIVQLTAMGKSVGFFGTEEDPARNPKARSRLFASSSDITTDRWDAANCDPRLLGIDLKSEEYKHLIARLRSVQQGAEFYDLQGGVSWADIVNKLAAYADSNDGKMHDVVIIDWAGPLATAMIAAGEAQSMHDALETIALFATQQIATKYNCAVVLFHQLNAETAAKKGPFGTYAKTDAQNCKKMAQHVAAVHIISPRDSTDHCVYTGAKVRYGEEGLQVIMKLQPKSTRFLIKNMEVHNKSFREKGKGGAKPMQKAGRVSAVGG